MPLRRSSSLVTVNCASEHSAREARSPAYSVIGLRASNDRVVDTLDDLLATPDVAPPIAVTQPKVLYEFADPALEKRSAGQKIMLRMGADNMARAKRLLSAIRSELLRRSPGK